MTTLYVIMILLLNIIILVWIFRKESREWKAIQEHHKELAKQARESKVQW